MNNELSGPVLMQPESRWAPTSSAAPSPWFILPLPPPFLSPFLSSAASRSLPVSIRLQREAAETGGGGRHGLRPAGKPFLNPNQISDGQIRLYSALFAVATAKRLAEMQKDSSVLSRV